MKARGAEADTAAAAVVCELPLVELLLQVRSHPVHQEPCITLA